MWTNGAGDDPVFSGDEDGAADWHVADLEALDQLLAVVVPQVQGAIVERHHHPRLARVDVATLDPVTARLVHFLKHTTTPRLKFDAQSFEN